jgi:hypothetical protein
MPADLADFFRTDVRSAEYEIEHLKQEIDILHALAEAKHVDPGTGVFTFAVPDRMPIEHLDRLLQRWQDIWAKRSITPPPLFPLVGDITIDKLEYNGFGLFAIHVPQATPLDIIQHIAQAWVGAWGLTDTPNPPVLCIENTLQIERMSDKQLQNIGLMRIPRDAASAG